MLLQNKGLVYAEMDAKKKVRVYKMIPNLIWRSSSSFLRKQFRYFGCLIHGLVHKKNLEIYTIPKKGLYIKHECEKIV